MAENTGHIVIVRSTIFYQNYKDIGINNRIPFGYDGGSSQSYYRNQFKTDEKIYNPNMLPANYPIYLDIPLNKNNYKLSKKIDSHKSEPYMECFRSCGRIWMTKGLGKKSKQKTKGCFKIKRKKYLDNIKL